MAGTLDREGAWHELSRALRRQKRKGVAFFLIVMMAVTLITIFYPRTYRSEAKLLVRLGRQNATLDPTATLGREPVASLVTVREQEINSVVELLGSRAILEKVVDAIGPAVILDEVPLTLSCGGQSERAAVAAPLWSGISEWLERLHLYAPTSGREQAVRRLVQQLKVEAVRKSDVVKISYEGRSPELAQAIVSRLVDLYLPEHVRLNRTSGSHEFLAQQTAGLREKLHQAEQDLRDLKNKTGLSSPEVQRQLMVTRIARLEDDLIQRKATTEATASRIRRLCEILAKEAKTHVSGETTGVGNEGTDRMRDQFYGLQLRQQQAEAKYTSVHPMLGEIRQQADEANKILAREEATRRQVTTAPAQTYEQAQLSLMADEHAMAGLQSEAAALKAQLAQAREELKTFNENDRRLAELQREVDILSTNYRKSAESLELARIDQAMESQRISNINLAQPATLEPKPVSPRVLVNLLLGLLSGLSGGAGLAWLCERCDHTLKTADEVEAKLELPVLASLPRLKARQLAINGRS